MVLMTADGAFYAGSEVVEFLKRVAGEVGSLITVCNGSALGMLLISIFPKSLPLQYE